MVQTGPGGRDPGGAALSLTRPQRLQPEGRGKEAVSSLQGSGDGVSRMIWCEMTPLLSLLPLPAPPGLKTHEAAAPGVEEGLG